MFALWECLEAKQGYIIRFNHVNFDEVYGSPWTRQFFSELMGFDTHRGHSTKELASDKVAKA